MPPRKVVTNTKSKKANDLTESQEKPKHQASIEKHPYLEELFLEFPPDPTKYICLLCTENSSEEKELKSLSGKKTPQELAKIKLTLKEKKDDLSLVTLNKYWVRKHLETKTHQGFTKGEDRPRLKEALNAVIRGEKNIANIPAEEPDNNSENFDNNMDGIDEIPPLGEEMEAKLYIDLCYFMVSNHLSYEAASPFLDFIKYILNNYSAELLERSHTSSTTTKRIIKDVICKSIRTELMMELAENPYSLLLDASSDVYGGKYLAVFARFVSWKEGIIATKLLKVIELDLDQTGQMLLNLLNEEIFLDTNIRQNLIGITTDNGSNMISSLDRKVDPMGAGLVNRLTKESESLIFIRDLCHAFNLVAQKAIEGLPKYIEQFIRKICSFMNSGNRNARFKELQKEKGIKEPLEILDYTETRWESLLNCTARILNVWSHLKQFFSETDSSLKDEIHNPEYHLYSYLLYILLHKIIGYVIYFQTPDLLLYQVFQKIKQAYTLCVRLVMKEEHQEIEFDEAIKIPFDNEKSPAYTDKVANQETFTKLFIKKYPRIQEHINHVLSHNPKRKGIVAEAMDHARTFLQKTINTMRKKLPYDEERLKRSLVIYLKEVQSMDTWRGLLKDFPNIIPQDEEIAYYDEVDVLSLHYKQIVKEHSDSDMSIIQRWRLLKKDYKVIWKMVKALLAIPYSTAKVESLFSEFKAIKTAPRNRISLENLEASIVSEQYFRSPEYKITKDMIHRYTTLWEEKKTNIPKNPPHSEEPKSEVAQAVQQDPRNSQSLLIPHQGDSSMILQGQTLTNTMELIHSFTEMLQTFASKIVAGGGQNPPNPVQGIQNPPNPVQGFQNPGLNQNNNAEGVQKENEANPDVIIPAIVEQKSSKLKRKAETISTHPNQQRVKLSDLNLEQRQGGE